MTTNSDDTGSNRDKKIEGRAKRRRFVQGTRAYTHAITNSMARRAAEKQGQPDKADKPDGPR